MSYGTMSGDLLAEYDSILNANGQDGTAVNGGSAVDGEYSFDLSFLSNGSDLSTAPTSVYGYSSSEAGVSTHDSPPFDIYGSASFAANDAMSPFNSAAVAAAAQYDLFQPSSAGAIAPGLTQYVSPPPESAPPQALGFSTAASSAQAAPTTSRTIAQPPPAKRGRKRKAASDTDSIDVPVASPSAVNLIANAGLHNNIYQPEPIAANVSNVKQRGRKNAKQAKVDTGHNAVEKKYRNNINNAIATLRDIIPALAHLKPIEGSTSTKRKPSQFNLAGATTAPAPDGLVDGILAAKTLSKGTILCKAIEYIQYLQQVRSESLEDIELLKQACLDTSPNGHDVLAAYESRRSALEPQRQRERAMLRNDEGRADGEDDDGESDSEPSLARQIKGEDAARTFPPSPSASSDDSRSGRSKTLYATFLGASFAGGLGLDLASAGAAASEGATWASAIVKRDLPIDSPRHHSAIVTALVFLGAASLLSSIVYLVSGLFARPATAQPERITYRAQRRKSALSALRGVQVATDNAKTHGDSCKAALLARKELLKLVGAPTYGLLPKLAKEGLATALRKVTTIRVGSFSKWSEEERCEAAAAWVRIAEIETALGDDINYLARCYTFLRLFNLSRSKHWPETTSSTARQTVDGVLALHLASLGQAVSAARLWKSAGSNVDKRKKTDVELDAWTELALSVDFSQARAAAFATRNVDVDARTSDTVPLLKIAESLTEERLTTVWRQLFVEMNLRRVSPAHIDELVAIEAATVEGSLENGLAVMTLSLVHASQGDKAQASELARSLLTNEHFRDEACCAPLFFAASLGLPAPARLSRRPASRSDAIAAVATGALVTMRSSLKLDKTDTSLHSLTLDLRRLMSDDAFTSVAPHEHSKWDPVCDDVLDAFVRCGRKAAGLDEESDSGIEL